MKVADIKVGERTRKDMGDIEGLAESVKRLGLLHPIVVKPDGTLLAGFRRLEAVKHLGLAEVAVTTFDIDDLEAERDENEQRKDFTATEAAELGRRIEAQLKPLANIRRAAGQELGLAKQGKSSKNMDVGNLPTSTVHVADMAAKAVGMSRSTYTRAKAIVNAANEDPGRFGDLPAQMDETKNVKGAYREMERRRNADDKQSVSKKRGPKPGSVTLERAAQKFFIRLEAEKTLLETYVKMPVPTALTARDRKACIKALEVTRRAATQLIKKLKKEVS